MTDLLLLIEIFFHLCLADLLFLLGKFRIVSLEHHDLAKFNFDHFCDDPVDEVSVMGDEKDSSRIIRQIGFKPGDRIQVEVVCRLVKKQDVRFC